MKANTDRLSNYPNTKQAEGDSVETVVSSLFLRTGWARAEAVGMSEGMLQSKEDYLNRRWSIANRRVDRAMTVRELNQS